MGFLIGKAGGFRLRASGSLTRAHIIPATVSPRLPLSPARHLLLSADNARRLAAPYSYSSSHSPRFPHAPAPPSLQPRNPSPQPVCSLTMTAILSPKPRRASYRPQQPAERVLPILSPPIYVPGDMTRVSTLIPPSRRPLLTAFSSRRVPPDSCLQSTSPALPFTGLTCVARHLPLSTR